MIIHAKIFPSRTQSTVSSQVSSVPTFVTFTVAMAPPSRRRVLPASTLSSHGAVPLYPTPKSDSESACSLSSSLAAAARAPEPSRAQPSTQQQGQAPAPATSSCITTKSRPHATNNTADPAGIIISPNGIKIGGWKIITQNSSIGDEKGMEKLTSLLEDMADPSISLSPNNDGNENNPSSAVTNTQTQPTTKSVNVVNQNLPQSKRKRRLCPPEITFLDAFVSLQYETSSPPHDCKARSNEHSSAKEDANIRGVDTSMSELMNVSNSSSCNQNRERARIQFTAHDALMEWAEAHRYLEHSHHGSQQHTPNKDQPRLDEYRGVSILKTVDAVAWSKKAGGSKSPQFMEGTTPPNVNEYAGNSEFYYDWTFASPYAGTISNLQPSHPINGNGTNNRNKWSPLPHSHIPFHLLQDTSQPILMFDDIPLYEDDLHDNGDVSLNIKVRVMPRCWYILQRLFIRVDYVCVKVRDVRMFCLFDNSSGVNNSRQHVKVNTIYRDISWREASWEELGKLGLPMNPSAWMENDGVVTTNAKSVAGVGGAGMGRSSSSSRVALAAPPLAALLTRLPTVTLPIDLPAYSCVDAKMIT